MKRILAVSALAGLAMSLASAAVVPIAQSSAAGLSPHPVASMPHAARSAALPPWTIHAMATSRRFDGLTPSSVDCPTASVCVSVGTAVVAAAIVSVIEVERSGHWSVAAAPVTTGAMESLQGVSCATASSCAAVGFSNAHGVFSTLIKQYNGRSWSIASAPQLGVNDKLMAVSCPSVSVCVAVGSYETPAYPQKEQLLVERWSGGRWIPQGATQVGLYDSFAAVSCSSPNACTAVGSSQGPRYGTPLAERWGGASWTVQRTPAPKITSASTETALSAVSCPSQNSCLAVGNRGIAMVWNGSRWLAQRTPAGAGSDFLGLDCWSAANCVTVGQGTRGTVIERRSAKGWTAQKPAGRGLVPLTAVSCHGASCTAVGYASSKVGFTPIAERNY